MTLRQLEYLVEVIRRGSFTAAAAALHVSQPTLSQQIRTLEREVGAELVVRGPGPLRPSPAGKAFIGHAQASVSSARRALDAARRVARMEPRSLVLATVRSLASAILPEALTLWHQHRPDVAVRLLEYANRTQVADAVGDGEADLGVGPLPADWAGDRIELGWEQLILVLPSGDPLADLADAVQLEALSQRDWVLYEEGHGLGEQALRACREAGFEPHVAVRTAQVEAAVRLAVAGMGPTLVPIKNVPPELRAHVRWIDPPVAWRVWAFVSAPSFGDITADFAEMLVRGPWQRRPAEPSPDQA